MTTMNISATSQLLDAENRILEMIARGNSLAKVLESLCVVVEQFSPPSIASILLLDTSGERLWYGAAPSLPKSYVDVFDGSTFGQGGGSCGLAVQRRELVVCADIESDPIWANIRDIPLAHGLRACWSSPILSSTGTVLGTFAIHSRKPRSPDAQDRHLIGQITHLASIATERAQTESALRASEAQLEEGQRLSTTGSFTWRVADNNIHWSKEVFRIYELDPSVKPTMEVARDRIHPEDRDLFEERVNTGPSEGLDFDFEHRLLFPDGRIKHLHVVARPRRDETGKLIEFIGAVMDETKRKRAEYEIRKNEREFKEIVDAIPQLIVVLSPDGKTLYVNQRILEYTGLSAEVLQGGDFRERVFHPEDVERLRDDRVRLLALQRPFQLEQRALRRDGQYRWILVHYNPLKDEANNVIRWYATGIDIDDRKQAENRVRNENLALREEIAKHSMFEEIIGRSPALRTVLYRVEKVAPTDSTVLITGETGTGKELIARALHKRSRRADRAFVTVNCAAFPPTLVASELFGHEKGAFTGALQQRLGRFEMADGGTIFLDEVGELSMDIQVALLRVLQEREFERVGGSRPIKTDVRVIAATHRDLQSSIVEGSFRSDLFYRLNVFPVELPPLRERAEDVPLLVEYFLSRYAARAGKRITGAREKTMALLQSYPWPGNIRELQNVIERSVIVCESEEFSVDESWLPQPIPTSEIPRGQLPMHLSAQEKEAIELALEACDGRVSGPSGAATKLGIPPSTLDSKIKSLKINKHRFRRN